MSEQLERVYAAVARQGAKYAREAYTEEVQRLAAAYAHEQRAMGTSWRDIGGALRISGTTVKRYAARYPGESTALVPVSVVADAPRRPAVVTSLVLVSPSGFRLEGLTEPTALRMLAALR